MERQSFQACFAEVGVTEEILGPGESGESGESGEFGEFGEFGEYEELMKFEEEGKFEFEEVGKFEEPDDFEKFEEPDGSGKFENFGYDSTSLGWLVAQCATAQKTQAQPHSAESHSLPQSHLTCKQHCFPQKSLRVSIAVVADCWRRGTF